MTTSPTTIIFRATVAALAILAVGGCASTESSYPPPSDRPRGSQVEAPSPEMRRKMADFIGMTSAFIRRVGQDVKAKGYAVIFTDVGPESLERDMPDMFHDLAKKSSEGGVQVRGFSRATKDGGMFRDKQTGEKGVGLWMLDFKDDGKGGRIATGSWSEGEGDSKWHEVKYRVVQEGTKWRAE